MRSLPTRNHNSESGNKMHLKYLQSILNKILQSIEQNYVQSMVLQIRFSSAFPRHPGPLLLFSHWRFRICWPLPHGLLQSCQLFQAVQAAKIVSQIMIGMINEKSFSKKFCVPIWLNSSLCTPTFLFCSNCELQITLLKLYNQKQIAQDSWVSKPAIRFKFWCFTAPKITLRCNVNFSWTNIGILILKIKNNNFKKWILILTNV